MEYLNCIVKHKLFAKVIRADCFGFKILAISVLLITSKKNWFSLAGIIFVIDFSRPAFTKRCFC